MSRRPRTYTPKIVEGDPPRYWNPFQHGWYCATHDTRLIMPPPLSKYDRLYSKRKPRPPWCVSCRREAVEARTG